MHRSCPAPLEWIFFTGLPIFNSNIEEDQLMHYIELLGTPPRALFASCKLTSKFFTPTMHLKGADAFHKPGSSTLYELLDVDIRDETGIAKFTAEFIKLDPLERMSAAHALLHPFLKAQLIPIEDLTNRPGVITTEL